MTLPAVNILHIHGGDAFSDENSYREYLRNSYRVSLEPKIRWIDSLQGTLGESFRVVIPRMPLQDNALYEDWKIVFERYLALVSEGPYILTGGSLGGIFLARYLSENILPRPALAAYLVCPPFDDRRSGGPMGGFALLPESLDPMYANARKIVFFFSSDDAVVPPDQAEKYRARLPRADIRMLHGKNWHFAVREFPEIAAEIRADAAALAREI